MKRRNRKDWNKGCFLQICKMINCQYIKVQHKFFEQIFSTEKYQNLIVALHGTWKRLKVVSQLWNFQICCLKKWAFFSLTFYLGSHLLTLEKRHLQFLVFCKMGNPTEKFCLKKIWKGIFCIQLKFRFYCIYTII